MREALIGTGARCGTDAPFALAPRFCVLCSDDVDVSQVSGDTAKFGSTSSTT